MKPGDLIYPRATVVSVTPNALLVTIVGPGGAPITVALDPKGPMVPPPV